jgi:segregation and condensation protein B
MSLKARVEATLFVTGRAMNIKEISDTLKSPVDHVEEALLELIYDYNSREGALEVDDADGYIIQVKEDYSDIVEQLIPINMSASVLKTLSAIAIKQPVLQSELVNIRGISAYDHINILLEEQLITKKPKGKSFLLKTTPKFNEYFKISGDTKDLAAFLDKHSKN